MVLGLGAYAEPTTLKPLKSPDGRMEMYFTLWDDLSDGHITYRLERDGKPVVMPSKLGFTLEVNEQLV